jgi:prolyl 4-hydroxylase
MRKVSWLTGKPIEHCELPQVGRYLPTQQYLQHYDAFDVSNEDGRRFCSNGGQRTVTVLVYLNHVAQGGGTYFPALHLQVQPRQGMALVFFPATIDGLLDRMVLHAALPAIDPKYVSQVWIRQGDYKGQPSKRLSHTMGVPPLLTAAATTSSDTTTTTTPLSYDNNNNNNNNHGNHNVSS